MPLKTSKFIWHEGRLVPWEQATVHVLSHALHYGSSVFEGIRVYETPNGAVGFPTARTTFAACSTPRRSTTSKIAYSREAINAACREVVARTAWSGAYMRPIVFRGAGGLGVAGNIERRRTCRSSRWNGARIWATRARARRRRLRVVVAASRAEHVAELGQGRRQLPFEPADRLSRRAALGFAEGIALGADGLLSEGAGENLFLGPATASCCTPPSSAVDLAGITRDSVITLAADARHRGVERARPAARGAVLADEVFMTGTAAEITPVRSVDRKISRRTASPARSRERLQQRVLRLVRRPHGRSLELAGRRSPTSRSPAASTAIAVAARRGTGPRPCSRRSGTSHVVAPETADTPAVLYVDLHLVHEVTSPQAFSDCASAACGAPPGSHARDAGSLDADVPRSARRRADRQRRRPRTQVAQLEQNCARVRHRAARLGAARPRHRARDRPRARRDAAGHDDRLRRQPHQHARRVRRARVRHRHDRGRRTCSRRSACCSASRRRSRSTCDGTAARRASRAKDLILRSSARSASAAAPATSSSTAAARSRRCRWKSA